MTTRHSLTLREDDGRTIVMEVPSVFKELGIAQRDEMWVVTRRSMD